MRRPPLVARCLAAALALALLLPATGCAWANRANRPVWNAFEEHAVPDDGTWFVVALPLTVPGGLLAILADTFVAHPLQVVDDAAGDAGDRWKRMDWQDAYYTELAYLPVRAVTTPIVFVGSFLGRSCFDLESRDARAAREREREQRERDEAAGRTAAWRAWLDALAAGRRPERLAEAAPPWTEALDAAFAAARAGADATGRLQLYAAARRWRLPPWTAEPWMALTDADPAIRYLELREARADDVPAAVREALRRDDSALVRELALTLWP